MRHLTSLRDYIAALRQIGEVHDVETEVDWNLEMGAVIRRSYELQAPAPLFNRIKGIEPGFRVLGAPAGVSAAPGRYLARIALSLGLPPGATGQQIVAEIARARTATPVPPRVVETGPCKENVVTGDAVDITRFPSPVPHGGDGGRYINTFGCIVARTPDGSWTNWSIARIQVLDAKRMTGIVAPGQHIGMIHKMWADQGRDMPFALALGVEPAIPFLCGMPIPAEMDEAGVLGAYFGEAIEVVRCQTSDLHVPATAEIVIEGVLSREEKAPEGPMGEYAGYNWVGVTTDKPVYHVHAMTFRNDPILPVVVAGEPVEEDHTAWGIPNAAEALVLLRGAGLPVTFCWLPLHAANHWLVVTLPRDWRDRAPAFATTGAICRRIGEVLYGTHGGSGVVKTLVMEDDVDPTDDQELIWAFATRAHPGTSEHVFAREKTGALAVYLSDGEKRTMTSTKAVYDCLTRDEWTGGKTPHRTSLQRGYPAEISQKVLAGWHDAYGYP